MIEKLALVETELAFELRVGDPDLVLSSSSAASVLGERKLTLPRGGVDEAEERKLNLTMESVAADFNESLGGERATVGDGGGDGSHAKAAPSPQF